MKKNLIAPFFFAILFFMLLLACNNETKPEEKTAATDTTKTVTPAPATNNDDMSAAKVAPNLYHVLKDTLGIRIVEADYKPGDSSVMHWHPDYAVITAEGGTVTFYGKDGSKMEAPMKTGMTAIKPGEFHSVKNTGKTAIKVILVEVNRTGASSMPDAALDATKSGAGLYTTLNDTLGMRILAINYKPGQSSTMHAHSDAALYVTDPGTAEFTGKDGKKQTIKLDKGMAMISPAQTHSVKNVGKTTMKAFLVEVNRAMK